MPDWLWQGLLTNGLYALAIVGGGVLLAYLQARAPTWRPTAMYGLAGGALVAVTLYSFTALLAIPRKSPEVTPASIETRVRTWVDSFGLGIRRETDEKAYFVYVVTTVNDTPVVVSRTKDRSDYLSLQISLTVAPEHAAVLEQMPKSQVTRVAKEVALEMARQHVAFAIVGSAPFKAVTISKSVPITNDLTEGAFLDLLDNLDEALFLARETIIMAVEHSDAGR